MLSRVTSSAVLGIDAYLIQIEVNITYGGLPEYFTVGLPDGAVRESKMRVRAAIRNSGYKVPNRVVTVNLAPASIKKEGADFDLPIAMALLTASEQITCPDLERTAVFGELSLDGSVRPVKGGLPIALALKKAGIARALVPEANAREFAMVEGVRIIPVTSLAQAASILNGDLKPEPFTVDLPSLFSRSTEYDVDFADVKGQEHVKRALEIAAAGGHNIIMIGPPGSGKTMLARRFPSILPEMTFDEALEVTKIHSITGSLKADTPLIATRTFRSPHHTISDAGLIGGGHNPRPGEVSLAHHGILFLDEIAEFKKPLLEMLRQPMEDKEVTIARAALTLTYPASFLLAAAMNPCPCGYLTDPHHECTCTPLQVHKYMAKISGPLMDRIDIHIEVPAVRYTDLAGKPNGEPSAAIRERVNRARNVQSGRFKKHRNIFCNAHMAPRDLRKFCELDETGTGLLKTAITRLGLSARAYDRILKVARTIADIDGAERIGAAQISEAIQYRSLDRQQIAYT